MAYLKGRRVSQFIELNEDELLISVWDESGYYFINRKSIVPEPIKIQDSNSLSGKYCTDLIKLPAPEYPGPNKKVK
jgi:hypothetical protein